MIYFIELRKFLADINFIDKYRNLFTTAVVEVAPGIVVELLAVCSCFLCRNELLCNRKILQFHICCRASASIRVPP